MQIMRIDWIWYAFHIYKAYIYAIYALHIYLYAHNLYVNVELVSVYSVLYKHAYIFMTYTLILCMHIFWYIYFEFMEVCLCVYMHTVPNTKGTKLGKNLI
jgi:hypothetical protein